MKINTKIRYGLRTIIEIANSSIPHGILQKDIAKNQQISLKYLDSIISSLKVKGLIVNTKGKGSGYKLTRPAEEISMFDIFTAFEQIEIVDCIECKDFCTKSINCTAKNYWTEFRNNFIQSLLKKNLAQIIEEYSFESLESL
jgi:Rrf2 family transcriptional regulator, iron-sulfur cluster assembly transcription factor